MMLRYAGRTTLLGLLIWPFPLDLPGKEPEMHAPHLAAVKDTAEADRANTADLADFRRQLAAENKSPETIRVYLMTAAMLAARYPGRALVSLAKRDIQVWMIELQQDHATATANTYFRSVKAFYKWAVAEDLLPANPMDSMAPPKLVDQPVQIPARDHVRRLLAYTDKLRDLYGARDAAVIRTWCEAGSPRREEMASLTMADLDLDAGTITVVRGKGQKTRTFALGVKAIRAWSRYLRLRARSRHAASEHLLVGRWDGRVSGNALYKMLHRRCDEAGVPRLRPHLFRHFATDEYLAGGGQEGDIMALNGWSNVAMLRRYGAANRQRRALAGARQLAIGDAL